ncbi:MAG: sigma-70 family RNA polymerase sigma factor [Planctomycetota bacterium]|nr:MAG: sigma-70 family RNA polymerase sigma factor [Planctomycetota bacterium]
MSANILQPISRVPAQDSIVPRVSKLARHIDTETPPSLLLRIRDHDDAEAWTSFTEVYSPLVYGFCRSRSLQPADAADVTQEVLLRVAKAIQSFDYDQRVGLFRDWLARIVINEIRRFAQRRQAGQLPEGHDEPSANSGWNEHFQRHILQSALHRCRHRFSEETWCVFLESWVQQVPPSEVARKFGVSIDKVYVARSRVLKQLRREVAILCDDMPAV